MPHIFLQLAAVLVIATILGIICRSFKQPLILAYIFTGIIISVFGLFGEVNKSILDLLSNLGIAFLLFLVGIDLDTDDLKYVGRAAIFTGLGQIIFTALTGFVLISALGFSTINALYMAFALTFSSTVIIIKLLSEKHDLQSLYGKVTIGYLLVQDFVAILALMMLSGFGQGKIPSVAVLILIVIKGLFLVGFAYGMAKTVLKHVFRLASYSTELLFVSAIAWAFLLSAFSELMGFSIAIGAFLAGVAVASSAYRIQISARVKPVRDFFIIIFFILLGASLSTGAAKVLVSHMVILSAFVLIGNPLIVFAIMLSLKFRNRTSFLTSVTVAQISEFSLILMSVGKMLGHVTSNAVSLVAAVGIITITISAYLILYSERIYKILDKYLAKVFPQKAHDPYVANREILKDHIILVGAEQMGWDILEFLKNKVSDKQKIVVVDFNPEIIKTLTATGYTAVFGDVSDPEVLEELEFAHAKLVIITDPDVVDNSVLIKFAKSKNYRGPIIAAAYWIHDAIRIYEVGADYVIVPETVGGKHVSRILAENWQDLSKIKKDKSKHFEDLVSRKIF